MSVRVAVQAIDPVRQRSLADALEDSGHEIAVGIGEADIVVVDGDAGDHAFARRVILLTDQRPRDADLAGVLPRDASPAQLDAAVRAVAAGLTVRASPAPRRGFEAADEPAPLLTPREMQILAAIGDGLSNKEIARKLGISAHTVKFHLEAVFAKLDATSRAEAVAKGLRRGLIEV